MKYSVWFEEKRRIIQYETLTVGHQLEIDTAQDKLTPEAALEQVKRFVAYQMKKALEEARK
jgi:hypothetical protein